MKLSFKDGRQGKIHIYVDDVYTLTVDDTFWFSEKWHKVNEINDEELADLTLSVNSRRAFLRVPSFCRVGRTARRSLRESLRRSTRESAPSRRRISSKSSDL